MQATTLEPQHTDWDTIAVTLVERGRVLCTIGEEQRLVKAGDVMHFPSGTWQGATMPG